MAQGLPGVLKLHYTIVEIHGAILYKLHYLDSLSVIHFLLHHSPYIYKMYDSFSFIC